MDREKESTIVATAVAVPVPLAFVPTALAVTDLQSSGLSKVVDSSRAFVSLTETTSHRDHLAVSENDGGSSGGDGTGGIGIRGDDIGGDDDIGDGGVIDGHGENGSDAGSGMGLGLGLGIPSDIGTRVAIARAMPNDKTPSTITDATTIINNNNVNAAITTTNVGETHIPLTTPTLSRSITHPPHPLHMAGVSTARNNTAGTSS